MQDLATKFANLTIQSDFIFKKVMSRKRICKHLLEELLQIEIADINYLEAEKTLEPDYTSRGIRLDIIVADDKNTHYNLEMQVKNNKNPDTDTYVLPKRSRYYQALLDIDLLQAGQPYDLLPPTYIIFICIFDFFKQGNYVYTFKKRCLENLELELPDEATTMLLNTKGTHGDISKDLKSFYDYVNTHIVTTDFTRQIDDEISYLKLDTKVRREYMLMEARLLDERREGIAEGKDIGFAEGKDVGLVEGEAIGMAKGEAIGIANANTATAKRLLSMGLTVQDIAKATSLSIEQVEALKAD
ncbi:Rpn family recombination-promoting nuclease/putative transposase [uncultured Phascolarctobacterium sp.]|uniref:Rpn family recombination-promoting nuclease/putative transposase n=1 Tax=uncultured Phascolarctobacterium sp. TaxID=512296 RepID=UPI0027D9CB13|nr:Rpn family recombination-promoting nuclease/putative transposase [uncultured Phascolarctobacterium sp.]